MSKNLYPVLPLRDIVVFPGMIAPLFVGRERSIHALEHVAEEEKKIVLLTQKDPLIDNPNESGLYKVGILASILQVLRLPDGTIKVLVEGEKRIQAKEVILNPSHNFFEAIVDFMEDEQGDADEVEALTRTLVTQFEQYVKLNKRIAPEVIAAISQIEDSSKLADTISSHLALKMLEKQTILEITDVAKRLERVLTLLETEISVLNTEQRIRSRVKKQMERSQREYYLNEQMKAIQKELTESEEGKDEIGELDEKIKKLKMPKETKEVCRAEIRKLRVMSPMSAEATVIRNYLDWMVNLPWGKFSKLKDDLTAAEEMLNEQHYGLKEVKDRVIEYLAVLQRTKKVRGAILCLVGPPGVGKTSLVRSIAEATGRKLVRMSLGGVRDEAEIRGHRRTYIGALPGKIIQGMKKAKTSNPVFLLDEIDKMSMDFRGDPASALLEVLDPEQNHQFADHYMEVEYDLSDVMFIATSNSLDIPPALRDRLEIIRISGYTEDEKLEIAKRHLIPKQREAHGFSQGEWAISDDAIRELIRYYTREAGVRSLEREIAKVARKSLKDIMLKEGEIISITTREVEKYAGVKKFRYGEAEHEDMVGITTGLAYTEMGGDLLYIEAARMPSGKGNIKITGKLGDVMQESVQAAASYVRSRSMDFGIHPENFQNRDMHVHVPEGATPKDGPSAGVAICTSIVSVMAGIPVKSTVAMTGEISLRGRVLPIGGLKEKLLAALRGGIKTVLIPEDNVKDLKEIPDNAKEGLEIIPISLVDDALKHALVEPLTPISWQEQPPVGLDPKTDTSGDTDVPSKLV